MRPEAGDLIPGSGGLRKLRWRMMGKGKRGGLRIIYNWDVPDESFFMLRSNGYVFIRAFKAVSYTHLTLPTSDLV